MPAAEAERTGGAGTLPLTALAGPDGGAFAEVVLDVGAAAGGFIGYLSAIFSNVRQVTALLTPLKSSSATYGLTVVLFWSWTM